MGGSILQFEKRQKPRGERKRQEKKDRERKKMVGGLGVGRIMRTFRSRCRQRLERDGYHDRDHGPGNRERAA
jgi:hypothetical protein